MKKSSAYCARPKDIFILSFIIILSFILWDTFILYPIKLLTVFMHETGHMIAGILTGAQLLKMNINLSLGGSSEIMGGNSIFIISSGYLGSFIFGVLFFNAAFSKEYSNWIVYSIAAIIILVAINLLDNFVLQLSFIAFALLLILLVKFMPQKINKYLFMPLGIISCLYTIYDIREDVFYNSFYKSDAVLLAEITGIPDYIWAIAWIGISLSGIFLLFKLACKKK